MKTEFRKRHEVVFGISFEVVSFFWFALSDDKMDWKLKEEKKEYIFSFLKYRLVFIRNIQSDKQSVI